MDTTKVALLTVLILINIAFVLGWVWSARRYRLQGRPTPADVAIGFATDFLDTLGIGSFAPTTALFKFRGAPADELIPGTLNVGHNAAAFMETLLFVTAVMLEPTLLACMIGSATLGAWLGQGWSVVCRVAPFSYSWELPCYLRRRSLYAQPRRVPAGGHSLCAQRLALRRGVAVNFVLGALMCTGIGNYAPSMIVLASGHAPPRRVPDHDGQRRPGAARGESGLLPLRSLLAWHFPGPRHGWGRRGAGGLLHCQAAAADGDALADHRRRHLRGRLHAALRLRPTDVGAGRAVTAGTASTPQPAAQPMRVATT